MRINRSAVIIAIAVGAALIAALIFLFVPRGLAGGAPYGGETITVESFYGNSVLDPELDCTKVYPVDRSVPKNSGAMQAALAALLKGPTYAEAQKGYFTSINSNVRINRFRVIGGVAAVDFGGNLAESADGACRANAIRAEVTQTLLQFPEIKSVVISVNGKMDAF